MKQRLLIILLTLLTTMTAGAQNASGTFSSGVTWNFDTGTKTLTFTGSGVIPDKPSSGSVPWEKTNVEHLVFGSDITRIGNQVFYNHVNLRDVVFQTGSQLTEIGSKAFNSCTSLSAITLPEHLTSIGNYAFEYCLSLASVYIPASVTTIGERAFRGCSVLKSVTIPDNVTTIEREAFWECTGLKTCTILSTKLTSIAGSCFYSCSSLTAIEIPEGVTSIGISAFLGCTSLKYVTLPESLQSIDLSAFKNCSNLKAVFCKVVDPKNLTIDNGAFNNNTAFFLPPDADIEAWEGGGYSNITFTWTSGDTVIKIDIEGTLTVSKKAGDGNGAMDGRGCPSELKGYIKMAVIEPGVTTIGNDAFQGCTGLTSVTIPSSVTTIGGNAFMGCTGLKSVTIPSSVTTIGDDAFRGCTGLKSVTIPEGVTTIGNYAFKFCTGLKSVIIGDGVTTIGDYAFDGCTGLTSVIIPSSVTTIGERAFRDCTGLTSVTIFAPSLTKYGDYAFHSNASGRKIYVPSGSVDTYKAGWSGYASDIEPLHYIIDEGKDVSILSNGTGQNVALKRSFAKGKKQTVCLPYAPRELLNYGKVWAFTGINEGKAVMTEIKDATSLKANTPYIFEASNDLLNITFPGVDINIGSDPETVDFTAGFTFHGTYTEKIWEATSDEVVNGTIYGFMMKDNDGQTVGQFVKARRRTVLRPFSCYLEYSGGSLTDAASAARGKAQEPLPDAIDIVWLTAGDVGSATGIKEVKSEKSGVEGWFSFGGRRLSGKPTATGIYIHEGKKIVVK